MKQLISDIVSQHLTKDDFYIDTVKKGKEYKLRIYVSHRDNYYAVKGLEKHFVVENVGTFAENYYKLTVKPEVEKTSWDKVWDAAKREPDFDDR